MKILDGGFRAVLRLYPADMRGAYGPEMRETFRDACVHASRRGRVAMARTALAELLDLLRCAIRSRLGRPLLPAHRQPLRPSRHDPPKGSTMNTLV